MAEVKFCSRCGSEMAPAAQFCPRCGSPAVSVTPHPVPPAPVIVTPDPLPPPVPAPAPVRSAVPEERPKRSTFFIWVPIALVGLALLAWAVLSGLPFSDEPRQQAPRPVEVVSERQVTTATVGQIGNTVDDSPSSPPARVVPRPAPSRPADVAQPARTRPIPPAPVRTPVNEAATRANQDGEISEPTAVGTLHSYISSRDFYGVSSECLSVSSVGYRNIGYDLAVSDKCSGRSLGRWRVDAKTREVYRQRPDGRYLRP